MQVTVCVRNNDIQLFAIGQEVGGNGFDMVWRFAEEAELIGVLLFTTQASIISHLYLQRKAKTSK